MKEAILATMIHIHVDEIPEIDASSQQLILEARWTPHRRSCDSEKET